MNLDNVGDLLGPVISRSRPAWPAARVASSASPSGPSWPGTTPEMIDWWFGWHIASTERYKLWHPQAHFFAQPRYDLSGVAGLSDRERYVGNTSWVDEYIGPIPSRLAITFDDPATSASTR